MADGSTHNLTIGKLAKMFGVSSQSIRNWEVQGKIPPSIRTVGGHRRYGQAHIEALDRCLNKPCEASNDAQNG